MAKVSSLLLATIVALISFAMALNMSNWEETYPCPHSPHNRILSMILAFNLGHIDPMMYILNEYVSMCEAGWNSTVVLYTTAHWTDKLRRLIRDKTFCYRSNSSIPIEYAVYDKSIQNSLGSPHRSRMARDIDNYDLFIYHEDDMVVKASHVTAYVQETKVLRQILDPGDFPNYIIGFQRYRRIFNTGDHRGEPSETDLMEQDLMEESPGFIPVCLESQPYAKVRGNRHQAMFMLTREQVLLYNESCQFLGHHSAAREDMSSIFLYDRCKVEKVLPAERFMTFTVLHYYAQRHVSWTTVVSVNENIKSNHHDLNVPPCWVDIVKRSIAEQDQAPANLTVTDSYSPGRK
jgi:hypothetical protein